MDRRLIYLGIAILIVGIYAILAAQSLSTIVSVDKWIYEEKMLIKENESYSVQLSFNANVEIVVNVETYEHCITLMFMDKDNYERFLSNEDYETIANVEHTTNYMLTHWNTEANKTYVLFLDNIDQCFDKHVTVKVGVSRSPAKTPTEEKALLTKIGFGMLAGAFWILMYGLLSERKI